MRPDTKEAVKRKFIHFIRFKDRKTKEPSSKHVVDSLKEIRVKEITEDLLKAYLFSGFGAICYDVTAILEARGVQRKKTLELWNETLKEHQQEIEGWIRSSKSFAQGMA